MLALLRPIAWINTIVLRICRQVAWVALAVMVVVILLQVFFRYVLNNALPWPDEAARFLMLWMTGLMAPSAFRWSGFVAITTFSDMLPERAARVLMLALLVLTLAVLGVAVSRGVNHTFGFGGNFDSSSLRLPLDWIGFESVRVKLRYMYGSLLTCVVLLIAVNVELILRNLVLLARPDAALPSDDAPYQILGTE